MTKGDRSVHNMDDKMAWIRKTGLLKHTEIFYEEIGIGHEYGIDSSK